MKGLLKRAMGGAFVVYGAGMVLTLAVQILLTRLMGADGYGVYYYVLSWLMILVLFVKLGTDSALLRFVPTYVAEQQWELLRGVLSWSTRTVWTAGTATGLLTAALVWMLARPHTELRFTFWIGCLVLPGLGLVYLRQAALRGLKRVTSALAPEALILPLVLAAGVWAIYRATGRPPSAAEAMAATLLAVVTGNLLGNLWLARALPGGSGGEPDLGERGTWFSVARSMLVISGMQLVMHNADAVMLGMLHDTRGAGIYGIASKVALVVAFPLTVANAIFAPLIAEYHSQDRRRELQGMLAFGMRFVTVGALLVFLGLLLFGAPILGIFGPEFPEGRAALVILGAGQLINALSGPVAYLLGLTGSERIVARVQTLAAALNIGLNLLLIPPFGLTGAALATAVSVAFWNITLYLQVRRRMDLDPSGMLRPTPA